MRKRIECSAIRRVDNTAHGCIHSTTCDEDQSEVATQTVVAGHRPRRDLDSAKSVVRNDMGYADHLELRLTIWIEAEETKMMRYDHTLLEWPNRPGEDVGRDRVVECLLDSSSK